MLHIMLRDFAYGVKNPNSTTACFFVSTWIFYLIQCVLFITMVINRKNAIKRHLDHILPCPVLTRCGRHPNLKAGLGLGVQTCPTSFALSGCHKLHALLPPL